MVPFKTRRKKFRQGKKHPPAKGVFFRSVFPLIGLNLNSAKTRRACLENQTSTQSLQSCHALRAKARAEINGKDPKLQMFSDKLQALRPTSLRIS